MPSRSVYQANALSTMRENCFQGFYLLEGRAASVDLVHQVLDADDAMLPQNLQITWPQHHAWGQLQEPQHA